MIVRTVKESQGRISLNEHFQKATVQRTRNRGNKKRTKQKVHCYKIIDIQNQELKRDLPESQNFSRDFLTSRNWDKNCVQRCHVIFHWTEQFVKISVWKHRRTHYVSPEILT